MVEEVVGSLIPCLGYITRIYGNSLPLQTILKTVGGEFHIETEPVEVLAENLEVTLLITTAVVPELKKVYLSWEALD